MTQFDVRPGGWIDWPIPGTELVVSCRMEPDEHGRYEPVELRLAGGGRITGELLRRVPLRQIEATANAPEVRDALGRGHEMGLSEPPSSWDRSDTASGDPRLTRPRYRALRSLRPSAAPAPAALQLDANPATRRPDQFYRQVADRYLWLARTSHRPAAELAEANDVPVTTAHRWIKEARRRGLLHPGRKGRTG